MIIKIIIILIIFYNLDTLKQALFTKRKVDTYSHKFHIF